MTITPARDEAESVVPRLSLEEARARATTAGMDPSLVDIHLFQVLFHSPPIANAVNGAKDAVLKEMQLDPRLRELIIMRVAWLTGSEYVWDHHYKPHVEHSLELRPEGILGVRDPASAEDFGEIERAVLAVADDVVTSGSVGPEALDRCRALLADDRELLEVVATAYIYHAISGIARSLGVPVEEGYARWEPDGLTPS